MNYEEHDNENLCELFPRYNYIFVWKNINVQYITNPPCPALVYMSSPSESLSQPTHPLLPANDSYCFPRPFWWLPRVPLMGLSGPCCLSTWSPNTVSHWVGYNGCLSWESEPGLCVESVSCVLWGRLVSWGCVYTGSVVLYRVNRMFALEITVAVGQSCY